MNYQPPSPRLISIVGRYDEPIYPKPQKKTSLMEIIVTKQGPLRPSARLLSQKLGFRSWSQPITVK